MKRTFFVTSFLFALLFYPHNIFASAECVAGVAGTCGPGESCTQDENCQGGYICEATSGSSKTCIADSTCSYPHCSLDADCTGHGGTQVCQGNSASNACGGTCVGASADTPSQQTTTQGPSGFQPLVPIPGLTDPNTVQSVSNSNNLATFFNNLYKYLIGLAVVIAIIEIIYGGLEISTQESIPVHTKGRERIQNALLGLALILSPVIIFGVINPSILNLSVGFQTLDTKSGSNFNSGGRVTPPPAPASGCKVAHYNSILQIATCATEADAEQYAAHGNSSNNCPSQTEGKILCGGTGATKQNGDCSTNDRLLVCEGKTQVRYYSIESTVSGLIGSSEQPTPDAAAADQRFKTGCVAAGGKVESSVSYSDKIYTSTGGRFLFGGFLGLFGASSSWSPWLAIFKNTLGKCPDNVTYNESKGESGVVCYDVNLACRYP